MGPRGNVLMPVCHARPVIELAPEIELIVHSRTRDGGTGLELRGSNGTQVADRSDYQHRSPDINDERQFVVRNFAGRCRHRLGASQHIQRFLIEHRRSRALHDAARQQPSLRVRCHLAEGFRYYITIAGWDIPDQYFDHTVMGCTKSTLERWP